MWHGLSSSSANWAEVKSETNVFDNIIKKKHKKRGNQLCSCWPMWSPPLLASETKWTATFLAPYHNSDIVVLRAPSLVESKKNMDHRQLQNLVATCTVTKLIRDDHRLKIVINFHLFVSLNKT